MPNEYGGTFTQINETHPLWRVYSVSLLINLKFYEVIHQQHPFLMVNHTYDPFNARRNYFYSLNWRLTKHPITVHITNRDKLKSPHGYDLVLTVLLASAHMGQL